MTLMSEDYRAGFARRLRWLMDARGLNVKSLLWAMGETPEKAAKVNVWLRGERLPSFVALIKLHRALRCSWRELMGE